MTFEENLAKLEALSNDIKRTDISLEDALKDCKDKVYTRDLYSRD